MMTYMVESHPMGDRQHEFARQMRAQPTDAERVLWQRLRHDIALTGSHFRRQVLVGLKAFFPLLMPGVMGPGLRRDDPLRARTRSRPHQRTAQFSHMQSASPQGEGELHPRAKRAPRRPRKERH
jgi:hypothetical protein